MNQKNSEVVTKIRMGLGVLAIGCMLSVGITTQWKSFCLFFLLAGIVLLIYKKKRISSIMSLPFTLLNIVLYESFVANTYDIVRILITFLSTVLIIGIMVTCFFKSQENT